MASVASLGDSSERNVVERKVRGRYDMPPQCAKPTIVAPTCVAVSHGFAPRAMPHAVLQLAVVVNTQPCGSLGVAVGVPVSAVEVDKRSAPCHMDLQPGHVGESGPCLG
eukprot:6095003-Prymnesium_polylepis.1